MVTETASPLVDSWAADVPVFEANFSLRIRSIALSLGSAAAAVDLAVRLGDAFNEASRTWATAPSTETLMNDKLSAEVHAAEATAEIARLKALLEFALNAKSDNLSRSGSDHLAARPRPQTRDVGINVAIVDGERAKLLAELADARRELEDAAVAATMVQEQQLVAREAEKVAAVRAAVIEAEASARSEQELRLGVQKTALKAEMAAKAAAAERVTQTLNDRIARLQYEQATMLAARDADVATLRAELDDIKAAHSEKRAAESLAAGAVTTPAVSESAAAEQSKVMLHLAQAEEEIGLLHDANETLRDDLEVLASELDAKEAAILALNGEKRFLERKLRDVEDRRDAALRSGAGATAKSDAAVSQVSELQSEVVRLQAENDRLRMAVEREGARGAQVDAAVAQRDRLIAQVAMLENDVSNLRTKNGELRLLLSNAAAST